MKKSDISIEYITHLFEKPSEFQKYIILLSVGLFSTLSFAPIYFFPSYIVAFPVLLIFSVKSESSQKAFLYGYIFGFAHFFGGLYWIGNSFAVEESIPDGLGYFMVAFLNLYLSVFPGIVSCGLKLIHKNHDLTKHLFNIILSFSILWSMSEWLRGHLFTGFPWNLSGYILGFSDIMLQSTAVWGIFTLGFIVLLLTFIPFLMLEVRYRIIAPFLGVAAVMGLYFYGSERLSGETEYVEGVNLRIVQANIKQQDKWPYQNWGKNLVTYMNLSESENKNGTTHIIWPESAVIYSLSEEPSRRQLISKVLGKGGTIFTGFPRRERSGGKTKLYNSLIVINEDGENVATYDKSHLVPFGEYIPAFIRALFIPLGLDKLFSGGQDFLEGEGPKTLNIVGLPPVGVLICYEVIFPGQITDPLDRPDWLLNITNDAWYGDSSGPRQHLLQTRVRAIEEGLPIVRSAGTGISALIDPYGRILDQVQLNTQGIISSELPEKILTSTIYSVYKEWIFTFMIFILILLNLILLKNRSTLRR